MFPEWRWLAVGAALVCIIAGESGDTITAGFMCALALVLYGGSV